MVVQLSYLHLSLTHSKSHGHANIADVEFVTCMKRYHENRSPPIGIFTLNLIAVHSEG